MSNRYDPSGWNANNTDPGVGAGQYSAEQYPTQQFPPQQYYQQPQQPQYQQQYYQQPQYQPQPQPTDSGKGPNGWLVALIVLLLLALAGAAFWLYNTGALQKSSEPTTSTVVETRTMESQPQQQQQPAPAPAPAKEPAKYSYSRYAPNTSVTSDGFAANVYYAFLEAYATAGTPDVTVTAYSPATGSTYKMSCSGGATVYCSGGNNAQVKIW